MKNLEDFTHQELLERKTLQHVLHDILMSLKTALDDRKFDQAILYNINGSRILRSLVSKELAIRGEEEMLRTLRNNVNDIFRILNRHQ